jgi:hypothetical protein
MKKTITAIAFLVSAVATAQDMTYARKVVDTLTTEYFWGRGYTKDGMKKAADYIATEMRSHNLVPLTGKDYFQQFKYPVNTFPDDMEVSINGTVLTPGVDFIVAPESRGVKGKGNLAQKDSVTFIDISNRVIVTLEDKLTWSVAPSAEDYTGIKVDKKKLPGLPATIKVNIENKSISEFKAVNVAGMVKGTVKPDSMIVFSAHYDHLGGMGENTFFPGANDNASGISMLLNLAKHYAANPQPYTMVFIAFAGEEAGLIGSKYFTENPPIKLKQIRFLLNVDLVGTGEEGITVVNATEFSQEFDGMVQLNKDNQLLHAVNARGKAANSDHYWFTEKGVPAFFLYTLGGIKAYHDVFDRAATLPLTEYADLFNLILRFNDRLMKR